jgi:hypothetical protein
MRFSPIKAHPSAAMESAVCLHADGFRQRQAHGYFIKAGRVTTPAPVDRLMQDAHAIRPQ